MRDIRVATALNRKDIMEQVESSRYGWRLSVRCVVGVLVVVLTSSTLHAQPKEKAPTVRDKTAARPLSVDDLAKARFHRVPGKAYGGASFDTGGSGSWYEHYASSPTVEYDGKIYRLWFVGGARTKDPGVPYGFYERIGLATSTDCVNWQVANDGKPVLDLGPPGSPDAKGLAHPYVLRVGEKFLMWYGAIDGKQASDLGLSPGHVRVERICLATSDDGIHWNRENQGKPVLDIGPKGSIDSIQATGMHVLKIGGQFVMWYGAYNGRHTLGIATSPDGVHWTKGNDGKSLTGLSGTEQLGPSVYFDGRQYFLFYNRPLDNSWTTYAAISQNGIDWQPANDGVPILGPPPEGNFGTAGPGRNHSVHPTQFVFHDHKVRVWYGAEDGLSPHHQRIGLMEADLSNAKAETLEGDGARKPTSAERQVVAQGAAWGVITPLSDGSLGLVVQRARPLEEIDACNVAMEWLRSSDAGKSWSKPVLIAERRAADDELYEKRTDGGSIVFQERNQALGQLPSGRIVCAFCELNYHYDPNGKAEPRPGVAFNHENQGIVYTWSDDLGKTWSKTRKMTISPFGGKPPMVSPHWRIVTLKDGTALMSIYGSFDPQYNGQLKIPEGTHVMCGVLRSTDNGETWGDPSIIMTKTDQLAWEETALCLAGDKLLAHVRTGRHNVEQYVSTDGGRTWKGPTQVTEPGQQPGGAFVLESGKLLFTWGNRRVPFGAAAMLSRDAGLTWDYDRRVSLAWDAPNANCGYANGAQAGDGTIVVVYYAMPISTDYRGLWTGSKVYALRFAEHQLVE